MTFDRVLKWISFAMLAFVGVAFGLGTIEGSGLAGASKDESWQVTLLGLPAILCVVTSYCQLFKPRPILVSLSFLTTAGFFLYFFFAIRDFNNSMAVQEIDVALNIQPLSKDIFLLLSLFIIPLWSNFRRYYKGRRA